MDLHLHWAQGNGLFSKHHLGTMQFHLETQPTWITLVHRSDWCLMSHLESVLGTSLSSFYISCTVLNQTKASNSKQSSHTHFGAVNLSSLWSGPILKLFNLSFCSILPESIWLQLFQVTCSICELLVELALDHFLGIVTNACQWDTITHKQQWQTLMCFISGCHWESSSLS